MTEVDAVAMPLLEDEYKNDNDIYASILDDIDGAYQLFYDRQVIGQRNQEYYANRQWSDRDIAAHERQARHAFVFNEIQHKIDHLVGTQMQTRMDIKAVPRENGDANAAYLLNHAIKWVEQVNDLEYIETQVFKESLLRAFSAVVVRWEFDDVEFGYPKIERIPQNELYWDPSAKNPTLEDARWMARIQNLTKMDLLEIFPEYEEIILNAATTYGMGSNIKGDYNYQTSWQDQIASQRYTSEDSKDIVRLIEHYKRIKVNKYFVLDAIADTKSVFDNYKEAQDYYEGLVEGYTSAGESIIDVYGYHKIVLSTVSVDRMLQTILIGDQVACSHLTALADFPFVVNFSYFDNGEFWAFVDSLIDPQILVNRFFSQWDYIVGTSSKNLHMFIPHFLKRGFTEEDLRREMAKTSPLIPVNNPTAIVPLQNPPANPDLFNAIQFSLQRMTDYAGGKNALGMQENAAESGKAVMARAELGGLARLPLYDALASWKKQVAYRIVWWIKNYMSSEQLMSIIGIDDVPLVNLDDGIMDSLRELKINITVDEASHSENMKERNFMQLKELFQVIQAPMEIVAPMLLEFSSIPQKEKDEIKSQMEFYKTYMEEKMKAQKEQKMMAEVEDSLAKKQIKDQMTRGEEVSEASAQLEKENARLQKELQKYKEMVEQMPKGSTPDVNALKEQQKLLKEQQKVEELKASFRKDAMALDSNAV